MVCRVKNYTFPFPLWISLERIKEIQVKVRSRPGKQPVTIKYTTNRLT